MISIAFLLCADPTPQTFNTVEERLQQISIYHLVGGAITGIPPTTDIDSFGNLVKNSHDIDDVCRWKGVFCTDGIIDRIRWLGNQHPQIFLVHFDFRWIPSTVHSIRITHQVRGTAVSDFSTRHLPKSALHIDLRGTQLRGRLDLLCLPPNLNYLNVSYNALSGDVFVTNLPPRIREIFSIQNEAMNILVSNADLPESLETAHFSSVRDISVVELSGDEVDERILVKQVVKEKRKGLLR